VFDTVRLSKDIGFVRPEALAQRGGWRWQSSKSLSSGEVTDKFYLNASSDEGQTLPRLTWFASSGYLVCEVSLPKLLFGQNVSLVYEAQLAEAFEMLSQFVRDKTGVAGNVASWNVSRVDYCYAWQVGDLLPSYLEAVSRLSLSRHNRRCVNGDSVAWLCKSNRIQFYSKFEECKLPIAEGVLRFEVRCNNTRYVAAKVLKTERTAEALLTNTNAQRVLSYWLKRLGMHEERPILSREGLMMEMLAQFGVSGFERHYGFLALHDLGGTRLAARRAYSRSTHYRRRKRLADAGFLTWHTNQGRVLPPLVVGA